MTLFSEPDNTPVSTSRRTYFILAVFGVVAMAYFLVSSPEMPPENVKSETPAAEAVPLTDTSDNRVDVVREDSARALIVDSPPNLEPSGGAEIKEILPTPSAPPRVVFRVFSDVDGAEVFVDRKYAGITPFESYDMEKGQHRINVSAAGYESHAEDVEIDDELTTVSVMFREVVLNESVLVIHKHRFGNCEGQLIADTSGIHYQTDHRDAFRVGFDELEHFEVDYLEHNLRLTVNGQRTYNFTDSMDNSDALFVFHREVEKARDRLARGDPPASFQSGITK